MKLIGKILKFFLVFTIVGVVLIVGVGYLASNNQSTQTAKVTKPMTKEEILAKKAADKKAILTKLKKLPSSLYTANKDLYQKLVAIEPDNANYKAKLKFYTAKVAAKQKAEAAAQAKAEAREMALKVVFGEKPVGTYYIKKYLQSVANDPDSITVDNCTETYVDDKKGWIVGCDYRGRNGFGGMIRQSNWFVIRHWQVIQVLPASAYNIK